MKWDDEEDPTDLDDDDFSAFETLHKDLKLSMDAAFTIDQDLIASAVRTLSLQTLSAYRSGMLLNWNDAELALYLVYIFGEIVKTGGKGRAAFCVAPIVPKEKRREVDYSEYPLTPHGETLLALGQNGVSAFPHRVVVMQSSIGLVACNHSSFSLRAVFSDNRLFFGLCHYLTEYTQFYILPLHAN
ncbi:uncharacterized protein HD556DRAFT_1247202 [Suillus plorans]|uniref:Exportin-T C-terminal domain-containing protein n=1 Tax=Suillus plorans TaxID=116603 RepID=A0A9P7AEH5_9AGAM|nr:uncharacterized protein HD556DRAFT_1247202 [Suillus plorans]KAG1787193.1 hypothetical protein HD556DRAFT_1247202 [Suillus plorans]